LSTRKSLTLVLVTIALLLLVRLYSLEAQAHSEHNSAEDTSMPRDLYFKKFLTLYAETAALCSKDVDVNIVIGKLKTALACIMNSDIACANESLKEAEETLHLLERLEPGLLEKIRPYIMAGLLLSVPLIVYALLPRIYLHIWFRLRRSWLVEGTKRLNDVIHKLPYNELLEYYRMLQKRGELQDPNPPRDFYEYITRLDYSLWFLKIRV